jgi:hypothetical protein
MKCLCLSLVLGLLLPAGLAAAENDQFTPLFDGKTFAGWEGNLKVFRIEHHAVVGGSLKAPVVRNEYLCTTKSYDNFELRLKFKLLGKSANGGVQIRSQRVAHSNEMCGYQADMGETWWGCLYGECHWANGKLAGPTPAEQEKIIHFEDWNDYVIRCQDRHIQLWVNGHATVDYTESNPAILQTGVIGLQIHANGPTEAWYKDIQIRPLPSKTNVR